MSLEWQSLHGPDAFQITFASLNRSSEVLEHQSNLSLFPLYIDYKKTDFCSWIPPSTQRGLVTYFIKTVQAVFPLLTPRQEAELVEHEAPLKATQIQTPKSLSLIGIFAISTALVARDVDSKLAGIACAFRDSLLRLSQEGILNFTYSMEAAMNHVQSICFLAVLELVQPVSGDVWELAGRGITKMEQLRKHFTSLTISHRYSEDFRRLELLLLKLEWYETFYSTTIGSTLTIFSTLALHFRRPSTFCQIWSSTEDSDPFESTLLASLSLDRHKLKISQALSVKKTAPQSYFESLIPEPFQITSREGLSDNTPSSFASAQLYLVLHPVLRKDADKASFPPFESSGPEKARLLSRITNSTILVIKGLAEMYEGGKVLSIWVFTEQVLEAGIVLACCLITLRHSELSSMANVSSRMGNLLQVSRMLEGCAERWKGGLPHAKAWEVLLPAVFGMLMPRGTTDTI